MNRTLASLSSHATAALATAALATAALLASLALSPAPSVGAQERVTADVVAARVQSFYDQTSTVQARFQQHFWNRVYQRTQSSAGRLSIQRPGKIRFDYEEPSGKVLVSDAGSWTMYEPGDDGAPGQYARGSSAAASQSAFGFLMGTADLGRYRRALRPATSSQPAHTDALELVPRRPDPHYRRIIVYVDNQPASLGVVRRVSIEDPDGNWNRFDFTDLRFNRGLDARLFTFTPPAGARDIGAPRAEASSRPGRTTASAPTIE
ncbi:MAG: outer membrane lipoprotein carrier protein LolA [Myxococcota bacterium]|nr:outer membrane lipoprotein carrier protein LolA [Myxococcota bacterium]